MEGLTPEDRAPGISASAGEPEASERPTPPRLMAAVALAVLVVGVALFVALRGEQTSGGETGSGTGESTATLTSITVRNGLVRNHSDAIGKPLPDLGYTSFEDEKLSLRRYAGRPLVINFWSSTCTPCITEMPDIQRVHTQLGDDVAILGLDVQDALESGRFMLTKTGVTYDVGRDPNGDVLLGLGGLNLPTTVFVASDGTVKAIHTGQLSEGELHEIIDRELR